MPTLRMLCVLLFGSRVLSCDSMASLSCVVTMTKWIRYWNPVWIPYGGNFQKAYVEEWEQEVHAPNTVIRNQSIIAGTRVPGTPLSHDSSDEGVSNCGPYWAPRHADSDRPPVHTDDGWNASRELSALPGCFFHAPIVLATKTRYEFAEETLVF